MRILILIMALLLVHFTSFAEILTVDPSGAGDFTNLETAFFAIADGDILELVAGEHLVESYLAVEEKGFTIRPVSGVSEPPILTGSGLIVLHGIEGIQWNIEGLEFHMGIVFHEQFGQYDGGEAWIRNCSFVEGGVGMNRDVLVHLSGCDFTDGGLNWTSADIEVSGCTFTNSTLLGHSDAVSGYATLSIDNSSFHDSIIYCHQPEANLTLEYCEFTGMAPVDYPTIYKGFGGDVQIRNTLFAQSTLLGIALTVHGDTDGLIENCTFRDIETVEWSPLNLLGGTFQLENCDFSGNSSINGPEDLLINGSHATLNCCDIDPDNVGVFGNGAVFYTQEGCTVSSEKISFGGLKALYY